MNDIINSLQPKIQKMIIQAAASIGCPLEYTLGSCLAALSISVGNSHKLEIKKNYQVSGSLYIGIIGEAGAKKSPSVQIMLQPITQYQKQLYEQFKESISNLDNSEESVKLKQVVTTDSTTESLNEILQFNHHGVLVYKDELSSIFHSFNAYKRGGSDAQYYLSIWNSAQITVTRKSLELPIFIENPFLTIVGGIQPMVLKTLPSFNNTGFPERILYIYYSGNNKYSTFEMDENVAEEYNDLVIKLIQRYHEISENRETRIVKFSSQAQKIWNEFAISHSNELDGETVPNYLESLWMKLESYSARVALILELSKEEYISQNCNEVSVDSLETAIKLIEFFKENARKVWQLMSEDPNHTKDIQKVKDLIKRKQRNGFVSRRDILNTKILGVKRNEDVMELFQELELDGFGKIVNAKTPRGTKITGFAIKGSNIYKIN